MTIEWTIQKVKISHLKDNERNPRRISKSQFQKLVKSIKEDGYHGRIMVDTDLTILGGHQRRKALLDAGFKLDDVIEVLMPTSTLTEAQKKRLMIRDNVSFGDFDYDILSSEFELPDLKEWGLENLNHIESLIGGDLDEGLQEQRQNGETKTSEREVLGQGDGQHTVTTSDKRPQHHEDENSLCGLRLLNKGDVEKLGLHTLIVSKGFVLEDLALLLSSSTPVTLLVTDQKYATEIKKQWEEKSNASFGG